MESKEVRVGIATFVMREKEILCCLRNASHGRDTWGFPGGHLEFGETWEQGAAREIFEETGLVTKNIRYVTATNDLFEDEEKHYITIFMMADYDGGDDVQLLEPQKHAEWRWFTWDAMPENVLVSMKNLKKQGFDPVEHLTIR